MQVEREIERLDRRSQRFFRLFNLGWMAVSLASLIFSALNAFKNHPAYLHQWQGVAIVGLMAGVLSPFMWFTLGGQNKHHKHTTWPRPLAISLPYWGSFYIALTLLNILDRNFVWCYFIAVGVSFSFFQGWLLIALVFLVFLSYSNFLGILAWPLTHMQWGELSGNGLTFASLTIICLSIQHLMSERHARSCLLQQLSRTNEKLEEAHRQLAESAAREQELAVLRERTRLAREMHDTLGHALVLVSVKLEAAQRLRERDARRCAQEIEESKEIIRESMKELRASIANLRSPVLEREPACRALSRYARELARRANLRVSYDLHPNIEGLPEAIEETLWRVGQEALANIEKHAQAQNVLLHISRQDSQIFLKIVDDGLGLPANLCQNQQSYASPPGHYGLSGMWERVNNIHGHLRIHGNNDRGTVVEVTLPLVEEPLSPA